MSRERNPIEVPNERRAIDVPNGETISLDRIPTAGERAAYIGQRAYYLAMVHHAAVRPRVYFNVFCRATPWEKLQPAQGEALIAAMQSLIERGVIE